MRTRRAQTATDSLPRSDVTPDNPAEPLRETATDEFAACSRIFVLNEGLYAAEVGELSPQESGKAGIDLPAIHVSAPPSEEKFQRMRTVWPRPRSGPLPLFS